MTGHDMTRFFAATLVLLSSLLPSTALAKRVALVIGNSDYAHAAPLPNPVNDGTAIAALFREIGFETVEGYDLDYGGLRATLREFARAARGAEVTAVFYAGHGIAVDGVNYIVPVDATLDDPVDWEFQVYDVNEILDLVRYSSVASLIFLDACRDNPLAGVLARSMGTGTRSVGTRGLARIEADQGSSGFAIAFATSPGTVAEDGRGEHSPFTLALLDNLAAPNRDIAEVMSRVTGDVYDRTERRQRPWFNASLTGPLVLNPVATPEPSPAPPQAADGATRDLDVQKLMFEAGLASGDPADFRAYLESFPDGIFADLARNALRRVGPDATVTSPAPVATAQDAPDARTAALEPATGPAPFVSPEEIEQALNLSRRLRTELQTRLTLAGHDTGTPDGILGNRSRSAIAAWQRSQGLEATGFFADGQVARLQSQTDGAYAAHMAAQAEAQAAATSGTAASAVSDTTPQSTTTTLRPMNNLGGTNTGRFGVLK